MDRQEMTKTIGKAKATYPQIRVTQETYEKLFDLRNELREKSREKVNMDETVQYLLNLLKELNGK